MASRTKNMDDLTAFCTDDCRRYLGPAAFLKEVGAPQDFSMSNAEYAAQFGSMSYYTLDNCIISHVIVDTENLKVAAVAELTGAFHDGKNISRTNAFFIDMTADGKKATKVYQHTDLQEGIVFRAALAEYKKADPKKEGAEKKAKKTNGGTGEGKTEGKE